MFQNSDGLPAIKPDEDASQAAPDNFRMVALAAMPVESQMNSGNLSFHLPFSGK
jgi:hypothetical protein